VMLHSTSDLPAPMCATSPVATACQDSPVMVVGCDLTNERKGVLHIMDYYEDDDQDMNDSDGIKQLRSALKAAQKKLKEQDQELDHFRSGERTRSVADVLNARGLNPKIADLIPSDLRNADDINRWVEERADVFAGVTSAPSQQQNDAPNTVIPPANASRMSDVLSIGEDVPGGEEQLMAQIRAAANPAELNRLIFGNEQGPSLY